MIRILGCLAMIGLTGCAAPHTVEVQPSNTVRLAFRVPGETEVGFASSLDQFTVHQAREVRPGQWIVAGLPNREFQYFYLVNGKVVVPECRMKVKDDFGAMNCRYLPKDKSAGGL